MLKNTEVKAWFDAHPFGTLRDSEGNLWRRNENELYLVDDAGEWQLAVFIPAHYVLLTFEVESDGSRLDSAQATGWLRAHKGATLTDTGGDLWRADGDGKFTVTSKAGGKWLDNPTNYSKMRWLPPGVVAKAEAPIATIGAAIDWLIAHPSEMLVDSDGDLWRLNGAGLECQDKANGNLDFVEACLDQTVVAAWRPCTPVLAERPPLPAGHKWVTRADGSVYATYGTGYLSVDNDDEAAVLEALVQEYRARRAK